MPTKPAQFSANDGFSVKSWTWQSWRVFPALMILWSRVFTLLVTDFASNHDYKTWECSKIHIIYINVDISSSEAPVLSVDFGDTVQNCTETFNWSNVRSSLFCMGWQQNLEFFHSIHTVINFTSWKKVMYLIFPREKHIKANRHYFNRSWIIFNKMPY